MSTKIYAVDFDNTLSLSGHFPDVGRPNKELFQWLIQKQSEGNIVVLWTCRCDDALQVAVDFCKANGLSPDFVNENVPEMIEKFGNDSRKIFAHVYIDDCAKTPWEIVEYQPKPKPEKPVVKRRKARIVR